MSSAARMGMVLSGGGSRAAFQVGVLKALSEMNYPIQSSIVSGFSAGAINATYLASQAHNFQEAMIRMENFWGNLSTNQVFRTEVLKLLGSGIRVLWDLSFGGIHRHTSARALLDTTPLRKLLEEHFSMEDLKRNLDTGLIHALAMSATDYSNGESVSFFECREPIELWERKRRRAHRVDIALCHVMASAAIPVLFPPVAVGDHFFGDGCLRNASPLSSAIHLGADKLVIVGVRKQSESMKRLAANQKPSLGRILSVILNAILLDTTDFDVERLNRINHTIRHLPEDKRKEVGLRTIEFVWITPSKDIGLLAKQHVSTLPLSLRYLLRGLGSKSESSEIASYLLFERDFCSRLVELGYEDAMRRKDELQRFFELSTASAAV